MTETLVLKVNGGWWTFITPLRHLTPFTTNTASARRLDGSSSGATLYGEPGRPAYLGKLPREYGFSAWEADYAVYSYSTPIAWHLPRENRSCPNGPVSEHAGTWVIPEVSYSKTTSKHRSRIATAISVLSDTDTYPDEAPPVTPARVNAPQYDRVMAQQQELACWHRSSTERQREAHTANENLIASFGYSNGVTS